ncbi:MAG TPA: hypothetical protein VHE79_01940, partial [Spirochaetia bacterium]
MHETGGAMGHHHHYWDEAQGERPPRFSMVGIVLACIAVYYLLTLFLLLSVWVKTLPGAAVAGQMLQHQSGAIVTTTELSLPSFFLFTVHTPAQVRPVVSLLRLVSIVAILAAIFSHFPINALLMRKRRRKPVPDRLQERAEQGALRSARTT